MTGHHKIQSGVHSAIDIRRTLKAMSPSLTSEAQNQQLGFAANKYTLFS